MTCPKGKGGRPAKPTHLHAVDGTYRPDRHAGRLDAGKPPAVRLPRAPYELTLEERNAYRRIGRQALKLGTLTEYDAEALAMLARAIVEYSEALAEMRGEKAGSGSRRDPAARADSAWKRVQTGLASFGLTPQARASIRLPTPPKAPGGGLSKWSDRRTQQ